ncbi:MAG: SDR family NAD(P)-dependent oxidoreductase [Chloroflexi bacterium]|nr:SDR family NAD(P)-dependent oxidoreductase [Chloroflexota bacterium]
MPKQIFITGATDGIGLALARFYKGQGERPFLLGRRSWSVLPDLAVEFPADDYCQADLAQPNCAAQVTDFLQARGVEQLDAVIHNAGTGYYGRTESQPPASINQLIDVNLTAPIALTQALLSWLPAGTGQVAFISSVMADLPGPDYAVYTATKAALDDFARNLRLELRGKVIVQAIHPGAARTGMHAKMGIPAGTMDWQNFPPAEKVAAQIAKQIARKRPSTAIGLTNQLLGWAGRNFGWLIDPMMQRQQEDRTAKAQRTQSGKAKNCVITGAADGIGKALARRFAKAGYTVVGVDVDAARAAQTEAELAAEGANNSFVLADLSTAEGVETAVAALNAPIDILIHNAGINAVGRFDAVPMPKQQKVIDVNLRAPLLLTAGLLAKDALQPNASLVFVSSLSKQLSYPGAAVYAATKAGLAAYARSLRVAFGGRRHVLIVYPGPTRTAHAHRYSPDNSREDGRMPPAQLADAVYLAVQKRRSELIPGLGNRVFVLAGRLAPGLMGLAMKKMMLDGLNGRVLTE